jgi:methylated-DNA-[protein]-cysteine S-methyltransferase
MTIEITEYESPLGRVTLACRDQRLCAMTFSDRWAFADRALTRRFGAEARHTANSESLCQRLDAYFAGALHALDGIAVDPGGTAFQSAVWTELRCVAPGRTTSYSELARRIGAPSAVRAVGAANGANPIWLVIPCHRTIGADGSLVGYGGGLERKRWLLAHEGALTGSLPIGATSGGGKNTFRVEAGVSPAAPPAAARRRVARV